VRRLDDLGEHSAGGLGVQEGHPAAADARAGLRVDGLEPGRLGGLEGSATSLVW